MNWLITGASSGIGLELSRIVCSEKHGYVVGVGRNEERLKMLERELNGCFSYIVADLATAEGVRSCVKEVANRFDRVDVLVNNAGFGLYKRVLDHSYEEIVSMASVNFIAPIIMVRDLLPLMPRGSVVVMVITAGVHVLMKDLPVYGATKIALHYVSEALRQELKSYGIHLLSVYPGLIKTEFHERAGRAVEKGVPASDVAKAIVEAVKKKKKRVYIPRYLSIARVLGPYLPTL